MTTAETTGHSDEVLTLALSDDGGYLASAGKDRKVCVWDAEKGEWARGFGGHRDTISVRVQSRPMFTCSGLDGWHSRGCGFYGQTHPGVTYQALVPNEKGLENVLRLLAAHPDKPPVDEIAVFTAATNAFSLANTNTTVAESLKRLERVVRGALDKGIRVRGYYISVVIPCPYGGKAEYRRVAGRDEGVAECGML